MDELARKRQERSTSEEVKRCEHGDADAYMLIYGAVSIRYCRVCGWWRVTRRDIERACEGAGLEHYQAANPRDSIADEYPGIEFLRSLGGHDQELAWQEDSDGRYSG